MATILITAPVAEPVTTAEFKTHHRISITKDDTLIDLYLKAARQYVERYLGRALVTQTSELVMDEFPPDLSHRSLFLNGHRTSSQHLHSVGHHHHRNDVINIPRPPLQTIDSIKYRDEDGVEQTFASSKFDVDADSEPGRVFPNKDENWPDTNDEPNAVRVRFTAGYGLPTDSPLLIPEAISQAIKLLASGFYENRESMAIIQMRKLPFNVDALLWEFRIYNMGPLNNDRTQGR